MYTLQTTGKVQDFMTRATSNRLWEGGTLPRTPPA
jgi:hypothetical protein